MGCKVSTPAATRPEPPAPFALPCLPNEFIEGDSLFLTDDYVPYPLILQHKCIVARIVNVTDGDTFRGRHIPNGHKLYPYPVVKKHQRTELFAQCEPWKGKLKGETLRFRIYGVDAPETAKMGRPEQPFAEEATHFMKNKLLNRIVFVRLLAKDQYGRLIVQVLVPCSSLGKQASMKSVASMKSLHITKGFTWSLLSCCKGGLPARTLTKKERVEWCEDVSQSLLMNGLATIYTGQNAQYNGKLARLEQLLQEASDKKVGIFAPEAPPLESPADFKRRMKQELLELPSAIDPDYVTTNEEPQTQPARGRSPERDDRRNRRGSASSARSSNPRRASEPRNQGNGKTGPEVAQQGRAKRNQRRKRKSRSRSARRRRAAERAAARAVPPGDENLLQDRMGDDAPSMSAQSRGLVQGVAPSQQAKAGSRKGLHVRGISEGDGDRVNIDTLTYSVEETPAATGSRRGSLYTDQAAVASMSLHSLRTLGTGKLPSSTHEPPPISEVDEEPVIVVDHEESIASGDLSENEYEDREDDEVDDLESESE
ncbi:hypothetical protein Emed_006665 [Eimeria media]